MRLRRGVFSVLCLLLLAGSAVLATGGLSPQLELGPETVKISAEKKGIRLELALPDQPGLVQANLEYWHGKIFAEPEKVKTNRSYILQPGQKTLAITLDDDPRIELNKHFMDFVLYFHFRFQDRTGRVIDTPQMVYYLRRVWYVQPGGVMTFFAQRRNVFWDKLPGIAQTITDTVNELYGLKQKKVFVLLYKNAYDMQYDTGMPEWAAALFWYNIWMRDYNTEARFLAELGHEYTHYLQYENQSRLPLFFMEGMSDYTYYHLAPQEAPDLSLYRTLMVEDKFLSPEQMYAGYPTENRLIAGFYRQSYLFVRHIAEKLGPEKFKAFIAGLSSKSLEQVIAETPELAKMGVYGIWAEIRDRVYTASPRPRFKPERGKYAAPVVKLNDGWQDLWGLALSSDASQVALGQYVKDKKGRITGKRLNILELGSGKVLRSVDFKIKEATGLRWSPSDPKAFLTFVTKEDGDKVGVYWWGQRQLKLLGGKGYNIQDARWSPQGDRIAFCSDHSGSSALYVVNPDGTQEEQIIGDIGYISFFDWLPSGDGFLVVADFGTKDQLLRLQGPDYRPEVIETSSLLRLAYPQLGPGGKIALIAYSHDYYDADLVLLDPKGGGYKRLTEGARASLVKWQADGGGLIFGNQEDDGLVMLNCPLQD